MLQQHQLINFTLKIEKQRRYVISERLMTPVDFCDELNTMINIYLKQKTKIYKKIVFKLGKLHV